MLLASTRECLAKRDTLKVLTKIQVSKSILQFGTNYVIIYVVGKTRILRILELSGILWRILEFSKTPVNNRSNLNTIRILKRKIENGYLRQGFIQIWFGRVMLTI